MKSTLYTLAILLLLAACTPKELSPVELAIQDKVAGQLGELKSFSINSLELVDSSTFADEIARRRHTIELRHEQNMKLADGYQQRGLVQNANAKMQDAIKDSKVLEGITALEQRLAEHDSLSLTEVYIYRFSASARTVDGASSEIKDMFISITPDNEIMGMDYKQNGVLKSTGQLIPGYNALF